MCLAATQSSYAPIVHAQASHLSKGYDIEKTGLTPSYPETSRCSPLTSLYASWADVDGTMRDEAHSGVDGGRLGEPILSPAPGIVRAVWRANWGWGEEGALLIRHSKTDVQVADGPKYYYSEFDHLQYDEIQSITEGSKIKRGQRLATVSRPGGKQEYMPEVHWEVWEVTDDLLTTWHLNKFNGRYWTNKSARLIDPLYMLALNGPRIANSGVDIQSYDDEMDFATFKGFTYILPCVPKSTKG
jgi:murein DD-endopeptidase MepM/ murein hydrolase activator NlpD